jgi:hypothetical protein
MGPGSTLAGQVQYFLGEEVEIPMLGELLLNPIENSALFVTAGGSKKGRLTFTFFMVQ